MFMTIFYRTYFFVSNDISNGTSNTWYYYTEPDNEPEQKKYYPPNALRNEIVEN